MIAPRLVRVEPTHGIAFWNNVVITNVQGHVNPAGVRGITDAYHELSNAYPAGVVGITVLRASLKVGSMDTNSEAQRAMRDLRTKLLHVAIVIENQGVLAQLLRTIIRTLNSVARSSRLSIAVDLEDAAGTIVPHVLSAAPSSKQQLQRDLLEAVDVLRKALPHVEPA